MLLTGGASSYLSNSGIFSNTGAGAFFSNTSNTGTLGVAGLTTLSNTSNTGTLGVAGLTTLSNTSNAGTLGVAGLTTLSNTSNTGTLGVALEATFNNNITQTGSGTTTLLTTNTGSISNSGLISTLRFNVGSLSSINISARDISTTTIGANTAYITNLFVGDENFGSVLTTQNISNTGNISTNTLYAGSISNIDLTFREQYTASTGTFRYSTLTTLFALPNTSLLYFNNLVVAGAYVWPGQTIQALNWAGGLDGITRFSILNTQTFGITGSNYSNVYVASTITGGSPPYSFTDVSVFTLASRGLTISNAISNFGLLTGTYNGTSPTTYNVLLTDNSTPKFTRNISFIFTPNAS